MQNLTEFYRKNGYVIVKNALDTRLAASAVQDLFALFAQQLDYLKVPYSKEVNKQSLHKVMRTLFDKDPERYKLCMQAAIHIRPLYQLLVSDGIFNVLKNFGFNKVVVGSYGILHIMANDLRIVGGYHGSPPHQDWMSMQASIDAVTLWTPLLEMDESCSPLQLVPGSHRNGLLPSTKGDHYVADTSMYTDKDFISLIIEPGDVIVMHCFTLHRSGKAMGESFRAAVSYRYYNMEEPSYIRRAYPNGYKRFVDYDRIEQNQLTAEELAAHKARVTKN